MIEVEPGRFEEMVVTALDGLPEEFGRLMQNVAVIVEHDPGPPGLLGLYEGIPLTDRTSDYAGVLRDLPHRGGGRRRGAPNGRARDRPPLRHRRRPAHRTRLVGLRPVEPPPGR